MSASASVSRRPPGTSASRYARFHLPVFKAVLTHISLSHDGVVEVSDWLQCRLRFRHASEAIVHYTVIWVRASLLRLMLLDAADHLLQRGEVPDRIVDKICDEYREHIDAAHAWLRASLNLWEKADLAGEVSSLAEYNKPATC